MIFASPPEDDIDWADMHPEAMVKFLGRVWRIAADVAEADQGTAGQAAAAGDAELRKVTHRTIDEVTRLVEAYHLNVAVARLMELVSATRQGDRLRARRRPTRPSARRPRCWPCCCRCSRRTPPRSAGSCSGHEPSVARPAGRPSIRRCWSRSR